MSLASGETAAREIVTAHARFADATALIEQRRAVYQAAIELLVHPAAPPELGAEVLDNPAVRAHLGEVLAGKAPFSPTCLRPLDELVVPSSSVSVVAGPGVRVAGTEAARAALAGAVARIGRAVERAGGTGALHVLIENDEGFADASAEVVAGARLALRLMPDLVGDLMPHVALVALLDGDAAEVVGSASAREFPGLVLIPRPASTLEVAEAIVHEGAHQKFFDLALTRDLLEPVGRGAPSFRPSWARRDAPVWPVEQVFAGFHAYCCLAAFWMVVEPAGIPVHSTSLLPNAAVRAAEIGEWLGRHGDVLGREGVALLRDLGAPVSSSPRPAPSDPIDVRPVTLGADVLVRRFGHRVLVARRAEPVEFFWAAGAVSQL